MVISSPSHSAKAASQIGLATPSTSISTEKLKAVKGVGVAIVLPHFRDETAIAALNETDSEKGQRQRWGNSQFNDESPLLDALVGVQ
jgi:hypothetical protein